MSYFPPTGSTVAYQITPSSLLVGASIFGLPPVNVTNTNLNVGGSVVAFQGGTQITSLVSTVPSSVIVGASIFGTVPVTQSGAWTTSVVGTVGASVLGTVPITQSGTIFASVIGQFAEDGAHTQADRGFFMLAVRNDAVASFVGTNIDYTPIAVDSAGRVQTVVAPEESRVEGYISLTSTSVTTLVAAAGAGLRNYITDVWLANTGASATLVTFTSGGGSSVLGYTIAPAGGGSNLPGLKMPIRTLANEPFGVQAATATSTLYVTVKGYKAP